MKPSWSYQARDDLKAIGRFIARDNPDAARRWVARLRARGRAAATSPRAGRVVPEIDRDDVREVLEGNYRIVYRIEKRRLVILTIFEGHRLLPKSVTLAVTPPAR